MPENIATQLSRCERVRGAKITFKKSPIKEILIDRAHRVYLLTTGGEVWFSGCNLQNFRKLEFPRWVGNITQMVLNDDDRYDAFLSFLLILNCNGQVFSVCFNQLTGVIIECLQKHFSFPERIIAIAHTAKWQIYLNAKNEVWYRLAPLAGCIVETRRLDVVDAEQISVVNRMLQVTTRKNNRIFYQEKGFELECADSYRRLNEEEFRRLSGAGIEAVYGSPMYYTVQTKNNELWACIGGLRRNKIELVPYLQKDEKIMTIIHSGAYPDAMIIMTTDYGRCFVIANNTVIDVHQMYPARITRVWFENDLLMLLADDNKLFAKSYSCIAGPDSNRTEINTSFLLQEPLQLAVSPRFISSLGVGTTLHS